ARIAGWRPEVHHLLARRDDAVADFLRKNRAQPWTAREHERVGFDGRAIVQRDMGETTRFDAAGPDASLSVSAALTLDAVADELARRPREQHAGIGLEVRSADVVERELRKAARGRGRPQMFHLDAPLAHLGQRPRGEIIAAFE